MGDGAKFRQLLARVALDEVPELAPHAQEFFGCAADVARTGDAFAAIEARTLLLRSANRLIGAARQHHARRSRLKSPTADVQGDSDGT